MQIETGGGGEGRKGRGSRRYRDGETEDMARAKGIPRGTGTERTRGLTHRHDTHGNLHGHSTQCSAIAGNWVHSRQMAGTASFCVRLCQLNPDLSLS